MPATPSRHKLASAAILALSLPFASLALASPPAPTRPPEAIYAKACGYCHGARVALIIRARKLPVEAITAYVRSGPRAMPAFRPTEITNAELAALAHWINASKADPKEFSE